jgi:hypothetical protein
LHCVTIQNDGDAKIVVGKNLDQIVLDESKDVLLEVCFWQVFENIVVGFNCCRYSHVIPDVDICTLVWALSGTGAHLQQTSQAPSWH